MNAVQREYTTSPSVTFRNASDKTSWAATMKTHLTTSNILYLLVTSPNAESSTDSVAYFKISLFRNHKRLRDTSIPKKINMFPLPFATLTNSCPRALVVQNKGQAEKIFEQSTFHSYICLTRNQPLHISLRRNKRGAVDTRKSQRKLKKLILVGRLQQCGA